MLILEAFLCYTKGYLPDMHLRGNVLTIVPFRAATSASSWLAVVVIAGDLCSPDANGFWPNMPF